MRADFGTAPTGLPVPQPISPGKKSSGILKGCLVIAGLLVVIMVVVMAGAGWYGYNHGGELFGKALEVSKLQFMTALTPDHTPEQRAEVERTYDQMVKAAAAEGFVQFMTKHEKSLRLMQAINADNKITPDESKLWLEEWNRENSTPAPETQNPE